MHPIVPLLAGLSTLFVRTEMKKTWSATKGMEFYHHDGFFTNWLKDMKEAGPVVPVAGIESRNSAKSINVPS